MNPCPGARISFPSKAREVIMPFVLSNDAETLPLAMVVTCPDSVFTSFLPLAFRAGSGPRPVMVYCCSATSWPAGAYTWASRWTTRSVSRVSTPFEAAFARAAFFKGTVTVTDAPGTADGSCMRPVLMTFPSARTSLMRSNLSRLEKL